MASRLITSGDTGAPQINCQPGSFITFLKAVLVDGFGATAPLGWTLEFEDLASNQAVFRPGSGNRPFYRIINDGANDWFNQARVFMYETMDSHETGMYETPPATSVSPPTFCWDWDQVQDSVSNPWYVIGDDAGFYFISKYAHNTYADTSMWHFVFKNHYIGDFIPFDHAYQQPSVICGHPWRALGQYNYWYGLAHLGIMSNYMMVLRDYDHNPAGVPMGHYWHGQSYLGLMFRRATYDSMEASLTPMHGRWIGDEPFIQTATGVIGKLPGIMHPYHSWISGYFTVDSVNMFPILQEDGVNRQLIFYDRYYTTTVSEYNKNCIYMLTIGEGFRRGF